MMEDSKSATEDYYSPWYVRTGADNAITIHSKGISSTHTAEGWLRICKGMRPESEHIREMISAIHWHFGPSDARQIMERYLRQINTTKEQETQEQG